MFIMKSTMYMLRRFLKGNTYCACRKFLTDAEFCGFNRTTYIKKLPHLKDFRKNEVLRGIHSKTSGNIEDISVKETVLDTLIDPTGTGRDMTGDLDPDLVSQTLMSFSKRSEVFKAAEMEGLKEPFLSKAMERFIEFLTSNLNQLPAQLHVVLYDIINREGEGKHVDDLFPFFIDHAKKIYPHFEFKQDLQLICDLTQPANWYPEARRMKRKIVFHSGPTNSGKTYHALKSFMNAESGVYCGPLRLLAVEVFNKCRENEVPCDLVTGEERQYHFRPDKPAAHISTTVEMTSTTTEYDVAVIDEIQMLRDQERGGAWTRVLLGLCAREIHLCGEEAAINLVRKIVGSTGDTLEVKRYERLTKLRFDTKPIVKDVAIVTRNRNFYEISTSSTNLV
ncbi:ATP-dependent RNA helicase SUV3 homolog, mitochondrial-like [Saccostrea echinata]|uniref:ATP-dependent RNA helicase SUV3 homolog, mitochondrial-like n=1 Tax=Saccostrea echinata TaxID=191078 RepID=UPI002A7F5053|nr:ATP-dependent RNA helicase SUV3 homolog, mitochondrial-like [Saccostrea echinata]